MAGRGTVRNMVRRPQSSDVGKALDKRSPVGDRH